MVCASNNDHRTGKEELFAFEGGTRGFVRYINKNKSVLHNDFQTTGEKVSDQSTNITVDVSMQWNDAYNEQVLVPPIIFHNATAVLTSPVCVQRRRVINKYIEENEFAKAKRYARSCVLGDVPQTKDKLVSK